MADQTFPLGLSDMELRMLQGKGYAIPTVERRGSSFVAISVKGTARAEALGGLPADAAKNLVKLIVRR